MAEQQKQAPKPEPTEVEKTAANDPHKHEAIPGAKGPEAIGSGQALPDSAIEGMSARLTNLEPEPPKVGPIGNVDLYETPGGYQAVPAGMQPKDVGKVVNAVQRLAAPEESGDVKKVAGPGAKTVKE